MGIVFVDRIVGDFSIRSLIQALVLRDIAAVVHDIVSKRAGDWGIDTCALISCVTRIVEMIASCPQLLPRVRINVQRYNSCRDVIRVLERYDCKLKGDIKVCGGTVEECNKCEMFRDLVHDAVDADVVLDRNSVDVLDELIEEVQKLEESQGDHDDRSVDRDDTPDKAHEPGTEEGSEEAQPSDRNREPGTNEGDREAQSTDENREVDTEEGDKGSQPSDSSESDTETNAREPDTESKGNNETGSEASLDTKEETSTDSEGSESDNTNETDNQPGADDQGGEHGEQESSPECDGSSEQSSESEGGCCQAPSDENAGSESQGQGEGGEQSSETESGDQAETESTGSSEHGQQGSGGFEASEQASEEEADAQPGEQGGEPQEADGQEEASTEAEQGGGQAEASSLPSVSGQREATGSASAEVQEDNESAAQHEADVKQNEDQPAGNSTSGAQQATDTATGGEKLPGGDQSPADTLSAGALDEAFSEIAEELQSISDELEASVSFDELGTISSELDKVISELQGVDRSATEVLRYLEELKKELENGGAITFGELEDIFDELVDRVKDEETRELVKRLLEELRDKLVTRIKGVDNVVTRTYGTAYRELLLFAQEYDEEAWEEFVEKLNRAKTLSKMIERMFGDDKLQHLQEVEWLGKGLDLTSEAVGTVSVDADEDVDVITKPLTKVLRSRLHRVAQEYQLGTHGIVTVWYRKDRRTGLVPGYVPQYRKLKVKLLIGVDVSGSISFGELRKFVGVASKVFRHAVECVLVPWDVKLHKPRPCKDYEELPWGGGTDPTPFLAHAAAWARKVKGEGYQPVVLLFSDGDFRLNEQAAKAVAEEAKVAFALITHRRGTAEQLGRLGWNVLYYPIVAKLW